MIKTAYAYGLRRNELCRLDVWSICGPIPTFPSGHLRVGARALRQGHPGRGPTSADRAHGAGIRLGRGWDAAVGRAGTPDLRAADHPALWLTERLTRVNAGFLEKRFARIRTGAGLDPAHSLHWLRHSYVTHLVEFGHPERFVQEQVGHHSASTTAIYTSVSSDFKNKTLRSALSRVYTPKHALTPGKENR